MRIKIVILLTLVVATPVKVQAEDLLTIYRLAQINDPTVQAARAAQLAAGEAKPQALANFLPTISANATNIANHSSSGPGSINSNELNTFLQSSAQALRGRPSSSHCANNLLGTLVQLHWA